MSFVDSILHYTKDSESPTKYYYWSALSAISAVVKDKVFLDRFYSKLYPNIYVLLVGRSGLRKGPPVNLAKYLVHTVGNTRVYAGRVSIQGIIADLSKAKTKQNGGPPQVDSAGYLVASEFSSFIIRDPDAMTILTDLYDRHYNETGWSYLLRNTPEEKLTQPTVSMLGASNEVHLKDAIPQNAIGGGFIARTFIIHADKKANVNSLVDKPNGNLNMDHLVAHLAKISKCQGEFAWTERGKEMYKKWYDKLQERSDFQDDNTGTLERLHDHVLKTAMLISLSRAQDLKLELDDIREAIMVCQAIVPAARRMNLLQSGTAKSAPGTSALLMEMLQRPEYTITRTAALQKLWTHFSAPELDAIAEDLEAQRAIKITPTRVEGRVEVTYILNPVVVERYKARASN